MEVQLELSIAAKYWKLTLLHKLFHLFSWFLTWLYLKLMKTVKILNFYNINFDENWISKNHQNLLDKIEFFSNWIFDFFINFQDLILRYFKNLGYFSKVQNVSFQNLCTTFLWVWYFRSYWQKCLSHFFCNRLYSDVNH